ncbi:MAG: hypothetical protein Q9164_004776, partial [Protoblastenia rupestris]
TDGEEEEDEDERPVNTPTTSEDERLEKGMDKLTINPRIALKARVLKYLRLVRLLYPALRKRRITTFPNITRVSGESEVPSLQQIRVLDALIAHTQHFTDETDEIAGVLYTDDEGAVLARLEHLAEEVRKCVELTRKNWDGEEDEFSAWIDKWMVRWEDLDKG